MTEQERVALLAEVQQDERAFNLLTLKMQAEGRAQYLNYGKTLELFGDPRSWPEYRAYVEDIKAALADFYTPEEAERWLDAPHPQLTGVSARAAIEAGRKSEVWGIVNRLRDCVYL